MKVKDSFVCRVLSSKPIFDNIFWLALMKTETLISMEAFIMEGTGSFLVCWFVFNENLSGILMSPATKQAEQ